MSPAEFTYYSLRRLRGYFDVLIFFSVPFVFIALCFYLYSRF